MLEGLLVDLVPFGAAFEERERAWLNGPMREWWGLDGLLSQGRFEYLREERDARWGHRDRVARFGVRTKEGRPIGMFALVGIDGVHRHAEVGAGIGDADYWGGGYGSDAMLLITAYAFDWLDLRRLWLRTRDDNVRAQRQVEKCGFTLEGAWRDVDYYEGQRHANLVYGLLREEWPGRAALVEQLGLVERASALGYGTGLG